MPEPSSDFTSAFVHRTKKAREDAKLTQEQVAAVLGIKQDLYKMYETRTPLPHRFVAPFCIVTRISEKWLFTGRDHSRAA